MSKNKNKVKCPICGYPHKIVNGKLPLHKLRNIHCEGSGKEIK